MGEQCPKCLKWTLLYTYRVKYLYLVCTNPNCNYEEKDKSEVKDPDGCKWYLTHKGVLGCFLHPLSDGTPSHCSNSEKYPCERLREDREFDEYMKNKEVK